MKLSDCSRLDLSPWEDVEIDGWATIVIVSEGSGLVVKVFVNGEPVPYRKFDGIDK